MPSHLAGLHLCSWWHPELLKKSPVFRNTEWPAMDRRLRGARGSSDVTPIPLQYLTPITTMPPKPSPPFLAPVWSVTWEPYPYTRALLSIWWWTATPPPTRSVCDDGRLPIVSCVSCLVTGFHPGQQDSAPVSKKDEAFPLPVSHGLDSPPPPATRCQLVSASKMDHLWQDSWATNLSTVLPLKEGRRGWGEEIQTPFFSPLGFDVCFTAVKRFER